MNPIDEAIAIKLFGWRWLAFDGIPTRDTQGYPKKCRVREFFPPEKDLHKSWEVHFKKNNAGPSTGDEPLSYSYCSSKGPHVPPIFHDNETACFRVLIPAMEKRGWRFDLFPHVDAAWLVSLYRNGNFCYGRGETVAEAICQAALCAMEGDNA